MSSPIAIARAPVAAQQTTSSSSPTGLYIPVHKRGASVASVPSSPSSSRAPSPQPDTTWRSGRKSPFSERTNKQNHNDNNQNKPTPVQARRQSGNKPLVQSHNIPIHSKIPNIYSITDLLRLSQSPHNHLSEEQMKGIEEVIPIIFDTTDQPSAKKAASRRRRTGRRDRKNSVRAPVVATVADVETHRKRHGNWGFQLVAIPVVNHGGEESWRHEPIAVAAH